MADGVRVSVRRDGVGFWGRTRWFLHGALLWYKRLNKYVSHSRYSVRYVRLSLKSTSCHWRTCAFLVPVGGSSPSWRSPRRLGRDSEISVKWLAFCRLCDAKQATGFAGLAEPRTHQRTQEKRQVRAHDRRNRHDLRSHQCVSKTPKL